MIRVWDKSGKSFLVHPVDARELIQQKEHFGYDPTIGDKSSVNSMVDKYPDDQDLSELDKDQLIEFAQEKFAAKLSVRFGEVRLRDEIQKLREKKDAKFKPTISPVVEDDEEDDDEE